MRSPDYAAMAEDVEQAILRMEKGLARVKTEPTQGMGELCQKQTRVTLLEEEIMEQRAVLWALREKAKRGWMETNFSPEKESG